MKSGCDQEDDPIALASEYLALNRRRRTEVETLSMAEMERWKELRSRLERLLCGSVPPRVRQRRALRVPTLLHVDVEANRKTSKGVVTQLSDEGMFIATDRLFEPRTRLSVKIETEADLEHVELSGTVVWTRAARTPEGPPGMGIQFDDAEVSRLHGLSRLVERALLPTRPGKTRSAVTAGGGDSGDVLALLEELRRVSELLAEPGAQIAEARRRDLLASSRALSEALPRLEARLDEVESLERERDQLLDRLVVLEAALRSTSEARDASSMLLAEIREVVTGDAGGGSARDLVAEIRKLNSRGGSEGSC